MVEGPGSVIESVVRQLREQILSGQLASGVRLTQREVAANLGVSRVPVRDALRRLEVEGLVSLAGQGAVVAPLSIEDLEELFELRLALEPLACRLAVPNLGTAQILLMRQCLERMRRAEDASGWHVAHGEFHSTLYSHSGRARLVSMVDNLRQQSQRYLQLHMAEPLVAGKVDEEHDALIEAVSRRDAPSVEHVVASHLSDAHQRLVVLLLGAKSLEPADPPTRTS